MTIYIFLLLFQGLYVCVCVFKSLEIQFNMCQLAQSAGMIFFSPFISCGSSLDTGYEKKQSYWFFHFYSMSIGDGKVLRLYSDSHAVLPQLAWAVNSHFPVFLRSERRKTGNCSFTVALIRGELDFPVFLRFERRKTGNCSFTAALIRGELDFPVFLRFERRKTCNCSFTAALIGGKLDFPVFLPFERRKTGICSFTAVPIGGKVDFPLFLRSEGRKTGICGFTAVPIGGKVDLPVFLRSERRKTGNSWYAAGTYGGYLSIWFFNIFSLLLLVGG